MFKKMTEAEFENTIQRIAYKDLVVKRIKGLGVTVTDKEARKKTWEQLEVMYEQELAKKVRTAFDAEPCNKCGFPHRKRFSWSKCPRCGK